MLLVVLIAVIAWIVAAALFLSLCAMAARASGGEPEEWTDPPMPRCERGRVGSIDDLLTPGGLVLSSPRRFG